ncbi:hypothetical protein AAC387_Pa09g0062 [Persea americana]
MGTKDFRHMYPHFRLSSFAAEENWIIDFTADGSSGKAANASFPPLRKSSLPPMTAAVKLQMPVFLLSQRRKTGKSSLPPMGAAVKLQFLGFLLLESRKTGKSSLPPVQAAVTLRECPNKVVGPFHFQLT